MHIHYIDVYGYFPSRLSCTKDSLMFEIPIDLQPTNHRRMAIVE